MSDKLPASENTPAAAVPAKGAPASLVTRKGGAIVHGHARLLPRRALQALRKPARRHLGAIVCVALPTLLAMLYFFCIAADLYASEARFVVRSPSQAPVSGISGLLQNAGMVRTQDDVYSVQDFIVSRDAIAALTKETDLRAVFGRPEADFLSRYPNLYDRDSAEDFYRYYQRRVDAIYDSTTGIVRLTVKTFRAEDSQQLALHLLDAAEALVNRLNERARRNAVQDAELQVTLAQNEVAASQQRVLDYRTRELTLDPGKASGAMFETMTRMQEELHATRLRVTELASRTPDSPLLPDLRQRQRELEHRIAEQRAGMAGGRDSMAPKLAEYEQLSLRQELADKELAGALRSLEEARAEARRQRIYIERVVNPNLPDEALYPRRWRAVFITFVSCFLIYSIGALLIAGVREHAQD